MADACVDEMLLDATRGHIGQVPLFDVLECKSRKLEVGKTSSIEDVSVGLLP